MMYFFFRLFIPFVYFKDLLNRSSMSRMAPQSCLCTLKENQKIILHIFDCISKLVIGQAAGKVRAQNQRSINNKNELEVKLIS